MSIIYRGEYCTLMSLYAMMMQFVILATVKMIKSNSPIYKTAVLCDYKQKDVELNGPSTYSKTHA